MMHSPRQEGTAILMALVFLTILMAVLLSADISARRTSDVAIRFEQRIELRNAMSIAFQSIADDLSKGTLVLDPDQPLTFVFPEQSNITWDLPSVRRFSTPEEWIVTLSGFIPRGESRFVMTQEARMHVYPDKCLILDIDEL